MSNEPKTKLPSDDPKWPPIEVRSKVLHAVSLASLIDWALDLGAKASDREEAVAVILLHEYGQEVFGQYNGDRQNKREEFNNRQRYAKAKMAEIEAKSAGFDIATAHLKHPV